MKISLSSDDLNLFILLKNFVSGNTKYGCCCYDDINFY